VCVQTERQRDADADTGTGTGTGTDTDTDTKVCAHIDGKMRRGAEGDGFTSAAHALRILSGFFSFMRTHTHAHAEGQGHTRTIHTGTRTILCA